MAELDGGEVVRLAAHQRAAEPGEPTCVICGRYGEYICDATDDDVCSLECRDICTHNHQKQRAEEDVDEATAAPAPTTDGSSRGSVKRMAQTTGSDHEARDPVGDEERVILEIRKRLKIHVDVVGNVPPNVLPPLCDSFDSLPAELRSNIAKSGLVHPTPVQMQTIPVALTGAHVLVSAPTGTGKTAAFLLPLVVQILETRFDMETSVPLGLVLAPIRELAIQIEDAAKAFMKGIQKMKTALVVGGLPMPPQLHRLRQGVQLVVATPGRLVDILVHHSDDGGGLDELLDHVRCCVVDEVDMMLSVGFRDAVTQILGSLLSSAYMVQFIFTSATISKQVEQVVSSFLGSRPASYVRIRVGDDSCVNGRDVGDAFTLNANVDHSLRWLEENDKKTELFHMLQERGAKQTLVFVDSRAGADMLTQAIAKQHRFLHARSFHAGKSQQERLQILEDFVDERVNVLVTTNVLGRGIDLLTVDLVVVFDAPKTTAEYVHIAGRVGRGVHGVADGGGSSLGASVMYVNARDAAILPELVQIYRQHRLRIPEEVYSSVRAKAPKTAPPVIVEEAKRAFRVLHELDHDDLASRASKWGRWKYSAKRSRYT